MDKALQEKIAKLQTMEQSLQQYGMKRQQFVQKMLEIDAALNEIEKAPEMYKIVGNIMVKTDKDSLKKDLDHKKEMADLRVKTLEKQESKIQTVVEDLKKEVMGELKKGE